MGLLKVVSLERVALVTRLLPVPHNEAFRRQFPAGSNCGRLPEYEWNRFVAAPLFLATFIPDRAPTPPEVSVLRQPHSISASGTRSRQKNQNQDCSTPVQADTSSQSVNGLIDRFPVCHLFSKLHHCDQSQSPGRGGWLPHWRIEVGNLVVGVNSA